MPRYLANVKLLLAHENRMVEPGQEFVTVFPKATVDGKKVDMKLGTNITLLGSTDAEKAQEELNAKLEAVDKAEADAKAKGDGSQAAADSKPATPEKRTPVVKD